MLKVKDGINSNASTATILETARAINGTNFNGSASITTANWGTARTLTIGNTGKSVNGSGNINWSLAEIGAAATTHKHGLLHENLGVIIENTTTDNGWSMLNNSYDGFLLKSIRTELDAPPWILSNYASGITFGGSDTKGVISVAYSHPSIRIAGGNGTKPVWWFDLAGTSGVTYDLASFNAATATKLQTSRTITIGDTGKSFNGSSNVSWSLSEMGVTTTKLWSGSLTGTNSITITNGANYNYLMIGGRPGTSSCETWISIPRSLITTAVTYSQITTEEAYIKFGIYVSGSNIVLSRAAGSVGSNANITMVYGGM